MNDQLSELASFFSKYGWSYQFLDSSTIISGFTGDNELSFTLFSKCSSGWIFFIIASYVRISPGISAEDLRELGFYLTKLNNQVILVKFAIDDDNLNVVLTVEIPSESLTYESFSSIIDALGYYAFSQYHTIHFLAKI